MDDSPEYEWDEVKCQANSDKHGVDFESVEKFEWSDAVNWLDERQDYGEPRNTSIGKIDGRLHVCVWTPRDDVIRVISLRRANAREGRLYEQERQDEG